MKTCARDHLHDHRLARHRRRRGGAAQGDRHDRRGSVLTSQHPVAVTVDEGGQGVGAGLRADPSDRRGPVGAGRDRPAAGVRPRDRVAHGASPASGPPSLLRAVDRDRRGLPGRLRSCSARRAASALVRLKCQRRPRRSPAGRQARRSSTARRRPRRCWRGLRGRCCRIPARAGADCAERCCSIVLAVASWKCDHGVISSRLSDPPPPRRAPGADPARRPRLDEPGPDVAGGAAGRKPTRTGARRPACRRVSV